MTDLPSDTIEEAERLTRLARDAVDENEAAAYRSERDECVAEYGYTARVRDDDTRDVLVLYPEEWVEDGVVRTERIDDTDRGIERPLSGPGDEDEWDEIAAHNRSVAAAVEREHGEVHGANAAALADFMNNHYAKRIERATRAELREFVEEYFPRNAWPTDRQRSLVDQSVRLTVEAAGADPPELFTD